MPMDGFIDETVLRREFRRFIAQGEAGRLQRFNTGKVKDAKEALGEVRRRESRWKWDPVRQLYLRFAQSTRTIVFDTGKCWRWEEIARTPRRAKDSDKLVPFRKRQTFSETQVRGQTAFDCAFDGLLAEGEEIWEQLEYEPLPSQLHEVVGKNDLDVHMSSVYWETESNVTFTLFELVLDRFLAEDTYVMEDTGGTKIQIQGFSYDPHDPEQRPQEW